MYLEFLHVNFLIYYKLLLLFFLNFFLLGTSGGTLASLNGKTGGSCAGRGGNFFPLKLAVYVCGQKEIDDGTCKRCQTSSCYENGIYVN